MGVILRSIWFVFVGWWLGLFWLGLSLGIMATVIGFPIGAYMISKTWAVMTFKRKPQTVVVEARDQR